MQRLQRLQRRHGEVAMTLDDREIAEFVALRARCASAGATLHEAVEYFMRHGGAITHPLSVPELVEQFIASREDLNRSVRTIESLKSSLRSLARCLGTMMAHDVSKRDVQRWLKGGGWAVKSRANHLGYAAACFSWGIKEGALRKNPCLGIEIEAEAEVEITTLDMDGVQALLEAARGDWEMTTYVVLGCFCGLRPAELERLELERINLAEQTVIVIGGSAKTGARRVVDIADNASAWLRTVPLPAQGRLCKANWLERWRVFRRACGWSVGEPDAKGHRGKLRSVGERIAITRGPWRADVMRHTFASNHYAQHQNEALLKAQMGHWKQSDTLHRHYRAVKTRDQAAKFWGLRPEG